MPISKTQRWLDLIAFMVKHRFPVSVEQIMEGVPSYTPRWSSENQKDRETVRRMFERDKDELRRLGIPLETLEYSIEYGTEKAEGYILSSRDFYLPYLRIVGQESAGKGKAKRSGGVDLERKDASAAVDALKRVAELPGFGLVREARSALRKVAFDLEVDDLTKAPVLYVDRPGANEVRDRMALLTDAVRARKKVRFRYHGIYRGEATARSVEPYGLLFQHGHWYLIGNDEQKEAVRVFRLGRMNDVDVNEKAARTPDYDVPAEFDLGDYALREPWELGGDEDTGLGARVRFAFPASLWIARNGFGELVAEEPEGATVREFDVHQVGPFLRWLQSFAGEATVVSPAALRDEQIALARETAAIYGEAPHA